MPPAPEDGALTTARSSHGWPQGLPTAKNDVLAASPVTLPKSAPTLLLQTATTESASDKLAAMRGTFGGSSTDSTLDAAEAALDPASAAAAGIDMTSDDIDQLTNNTVKAEEQATGAYQGDMMPSSSAQLQLWQAWGSGKKVPDAMFLAAGMKATTTYYGGGTPWASSNMKYCYASHVSEAIKKVHTDAFSQFTKAIPCLSFTNVGLKTDGDGNDAVAGGTAECNASPAVYITT